MLLWGDALGQVWVRLAGFWDSSWLGGRVCVSQRWAPVTQMAVTRGKQHNGRK